MIIKRVEHAALFSSINASRPSTPTRGMPVANARPLTVAKTTLNVVKGPGPWYAARKSHSLTNVLLRSQISDSEIIRSLLA